MVLGLAAGLPAASPSAQVAQLAPSARSVQTRTLSARLWTPDGIAIGPDGRVYVAEYGGGLGTRVLVIGLEGQVSTFADGLRAPDGLAFDRHGDLFVSSFAGGTVHRVRPDGTMTLFASGLDHPSALAFDAAGDLYVSEFGEFNGTKVSRITPAGVVAAHAHGFSAPLGLAIGPDGALYVASFLSGDIHRVAGDSVTRFASIPNTPLAQLQYLAFDAEGTLYVSSLGHHRVYAIDRAGGVRPFAGSGVAGARDGDAATARLHTPNSIAVRGDTVLFTEYATGRLRLVIPDGRRRTAPLPDTDATLSGAPFADDSAVFVVTQHTPGVAGTRVDSLGVVHVVRRRVGDRLVFVQAWETVQLRAIDTLELDGRTLRPSERRSGPPERRFRATYGAQEVLARTVRPDRTDTLRVPIAGDAVLDASAPELLLAAIDPADSTGVLSLFVPAQRGMVRGAVRTRRDPAAADAWDVELVYPSAVVTVRVRARGRLVERSTYDFGARTLTFSRIDPP